MPRGAGGRAQEIRSAMEPRPPSGLPQERRLWAVAAGHALHIFNKWRKRQFGGYEATLVWIMEGIKNLIFSFDGLTRNCCCFNLQLIGCRRKVGTRPEKDSMANLFTPAMCMCCCCQGCAVRACSLG